MVFLILIIGIVIGIVIGYKALLNNLIDNDIISYDSYFSYENNIWDVIWNSFKL